MGQKAAGGKSDFGFQGRPGIDASSEDDRTLYTFRAEVQGLRYQAQGYTERYLTGGEAVVTLIQEDQQIVCQMGRYQVFPDDESGQKDYLELSITSHKLMMIKIRNRQSKRAKGRPSAIYDMPGNQRKSKESLNQKNIKTRQREQRKRHIDFVKENT